MGLTANIGYLMLAVFLAIGSWTALKNSYSASKTISLLLAGTYLAVLATALFLPMQLNYVSDGNPVPFYLLHPGAYTAELVNALGISGFAAAAGIRLLFFMPLGWIACTLKDSWKGLDNPYRTIAIWAVSIEVLQELQNLLAGNAYRRVCIDDLAVEVLGAALGIAFFTACRRCGCRDGAIGID